MFYVYILQSLKDGSYYVGQTKNLSDSFERHNSGRRLATRAKVPWERVHTEVFSTRSGAVKREQEIKSQKSRLYIERLLSHSDGA
jgi:putative endonuclease